jgi:diguanylate cyclase (GGDEF)-like protein
MVEEELAAVHLATVDELTGIANRRGFMQLGEYGLHLSAREGLTATLMFLDLDGFKQINDTYGHAEGDCALQRFARELRGAFRESDVVGRLGGDEFAVLLLRRDAGGTDALVQRLTRALAEQDRAHGMGYSVRFSHGAVEFDPDKHACIGDLIKEGDRLMYAIKRSKVEAGAVTGKAQAGG